MSVFLLNFLIQFAIRWGVPWLALKLPFVPPAVVAIIEKLLVDLGGNHSPVAKETLSWLACKEVDEHFRATIKK